jgi:hypothetical protein
VELGGLLLGALKGLLLFRAEIDGAGFQFGLAQFQFGLPGQQFRAIGVKVLDLGLVLLQQVLLGLLQFGLQASQVLFTKLQRLLGLFAIGGGLLAGA